MILELSQMEFELVKLLCATFLIMKALDTFMTMLRTEGIDLLSLIPRPWRKRDEEENEFAV